MAGVFGCGGGTPSREQIPLLRQRLARLQEAIAQRNRAAIDSIMSVQALSLDLSSDSLLSYVYGPERDFAFEKLGDYEILYTKKKARIDCYIMDSTESTDRPLTLTFVHEHDQWLLKRFEPGVAKPKTIPPEG
jgi:hypothetical protein